MTSLPMLCLTKTDATSQPGQRSQTFISHNFPSFFRREQQLRGYLIRYISEGKERFRTRNQIFVLRAGQYLVLNPQNGVSYESLSESKGLWIYLPEKVVRSFFQNKGKKEQKEENPLMMNGKEVPAFCEHTYETSADELGRLLRKSDFQVQKAETYLEALYRSQKEVFARLGRLTSAKLTTKIELFRRLCHARHHIHANLDAPLDLDTLSQVACLSKYHFIRLFKEAYGQTPRQYLIARRLERARSLLLQSDKTFHEICHEVGLKDSSSFGRLFKRSYGATPQIYRQMYAVA